MIEQILALRTNDPITISDDRSKDLTSQDKFIVTMTDHYSLVDDIQVAITEIEDYYLIVTDITGDCHYAICEIYDENIQQYPNQNDFNEEFVLIGGEEEQIYTLIDHACCEDQMQCFGEYSNENYFNFILIHRNNNYTKIYRGITLDEECISCFTKP